MKNEKMKNENVRFDGMKGSWCVIDEYHSIEGSFYLWENEQHGEDVPAVLTDDKLHVLDNECCSGIYTALQDNGLVR